jgi:lactoylglutathione lyase
MSHVAVRSHPHRVMHTMIRVTDLDRSIRFYGLLGMRLLRRQAFPESRFSIVMMGYGAEDESAAIELTHNWDTSSYVIGTAYGHIALATTNVYELCSDLTAQDIKVIRAPGPMRGGPTLAVVEDPDGYRVELIEVSASHPLGHHAETI